MAEELETRRQREAVRGRFTEKHTADSQTPYRPRRCVTALQRSGEKEEFHVGKRGQE